MESYAWEILVWKYLILSPFTLTLPTPLKISLPKTTKEYPYSNEYNWSTQFEGI